jgi:hypothetical protein
MEMDAGARIHAMPMRACALGACPSLHRPGLLHLQKPPEELVPVEGVVALPVTKDVTLLRGTCKERLK